MGLFFRKALSKPAHPAHMASMPGEGLVHGRMHQWQPQVKVSGFEAYVSGFRVKGFRFLRFGGRAGGWG